MKKKLTTLAFASQTIAIVERLLVFGAGLAAGTIMLVVVFGVVMRYVFVSPLGWSYDLVGFYLMVGMFFFSLADTLNHHGHVSIDIFRNFIPFRIHHVALATSYAAATFVMALIVWQAYSRLSSAWLFDERLGSSAAWPTWPSYLLIVIGASVMTLRTALQSIGHLLSAATGQLLVNMPPLATAHDVREEGE